MRPVSLALLALNITIGVFAADVWVIGAGGFTQTGTCVNYRWLADPILYNLTDQTMDVRVVHVSNGDTDNVVVTVPPASTMLVRAAAGFGRDPIWVTHLDVPQGIGVEGRMEYFAADACPPFVSDPRPLGKLRMPVFTQLIPPNIEQVHLGTDLGEQAVRVNVAVYNAGQIDAVASATLHFPTTSCHDTNPLTRTFIVPADTVMQVPMGEISCTAGVIWPSYVSVVVDQPSLSFVSTLSNEAVPNVTVTVTP